MSETKKKANRQPATPAEERARTVQYLRDKAKIGKLTGEMNTELVLALADRLEAGKHWSEFELG